MRWEQRNLHFKNTALKLKILMGFAFSYTGEVDIRFAEKGAENVFFVKIHFC